MKADIFASELFKILNNIPLFILRDYWQSFALSFGGFCVWRGFSIFTCRTFQPPEIMDSYCLLFKRTMELIAPLINTSGAIIRAVMKKIACNFSNKNIKFLKFMAKT